MKFKLLLLRILFLFRILLLLETFNFLLALLGYLCITLPLSHVFIEFAVRNIKSQLLDLDLFYEVFDIVTLLFFLFLVTFQIVNLDFNILSVAFEFLVFIVCRPVSVV